MAVGQQLRREMCRLQRRPLSLRAIHSTPATHDQNPTIILQSLQTRLTCPTKVHKRRAGCPEEHDEGDVLGPPVGVAIILLCALLFACYLNPAAA